MHGGIREGARDDAAVLLHGIARSSSSLAKIERALQDEGLLTLNLDYPSRRMSLEELAETIHPRILGLSGSISGRLHFVTHSMGGLLARAYLARYRPANLGHVVMLGPPNQGSEVADILERNPLYRAFFGPAGAQLVTRRDDVMATMLGTIDYPVGIIAGRHSVYPVASFFVIKEPSDGRVSVRRTAVEGMADHLVLPVTHPTMMNNAEVIRQVIHFLRNGRFGTA